MTELFSIENALNLAVLIFLQAVLGFDNLLYLSIESKRAPEKDQSRVRRIGIVMAVALRVGLLFLILALLDAFAEPFYTVARPGVVEGSFTFGTVVFFVGGVFIIYTALKEIRHMIAVEKLDEVGERTPKSVGQVIALIVVMNLIFSFDSILSAVAITRVVPVLTIAILTSGAAMYFLADHVAEFLERNRKYEVLGLFILLLVGFVLLGEGGHEAHLKIANYPVEPMSKMTFYFSIIVLVVVDVLQTGYQKKLQRQRDKQSGAASK